MAIYGEILGIRSKVAKLDIGHLRKGGLTIYGGLSGFTRRWPSGSAAISKNQRSCFLSRRRAAAERCGELSK